jgi:hypothetical protein
MTKLPWQEHRQHDSASTPLCGQVATTATLPAGLSIDIAVRPTSPQQQHRQHDLASILRHGQVTTAATLPA